MYIVCSGKLIYVNSDGESEYVIEGQWISEATLWTQWVHAGDLIATNDCRLFALDANEFQKIASHFENDEWTRGYATQFVKALNRVKEEELSDMFGRMKGVNGQAASGSGRLGDGPSNIAAVAK